MAQAKLQVERALKVIPSDTIGVPEVSKKTISSTATATTASKLVDSAGLFTTTDKVAIGDVVYNDTDATVATVTAIDSETTLSLSVDIMADTEAYSIYRGATNSTLLYIGGTGDVKVETAAGDIVTYIAMAAGFMPVHVKKVYSTGTSATDIIANW